MIKITQVNTYFVVDIGDNRIHMLNEKSLIYFLKKQVGLKMSAIKLALSWFATQSEVIIHDDRVAS